MPLLGALAILAGITGCGKGLGMVHVRGKVTYKDGSAPKGGARAIRFEPAQDTTAEVRKAAAGEIGTDGSFEMFTKRPGDGVIPGKYNVTFTVVKGSHDPVSLIQEKYTVSATTPYKDVTIDRDVDDLKFEIEPIQPADGAAAAMQPKL
jgi:hypothetical protein